MEESVEASQRCRGREVWPGEQVKKDKSLKCPNFPNQSHPIIQIIPHHHPIVRIILKTYQLSRLLSINHSIFRLRNSLEPVNYLNYPPNYPDFSQLTTQLFQPTTQLSRLFPGTIELSKLFSIIQIILN